MHALFMTNGARHHLAIQQIPDLSAALRLSTPVLAEQHLLVNLLEEQIAFYHLRAARLPDGRKLIAAIEPGAITQSLLSAGPLGPYLPYSCTLQPGDLARAGWLWKARDSARIADNLDDPVPHGREWIIFLLKLHIERCQRAEQLLARLAGTPSDSEQMVVRLSHLLNELLLADFEELAQFLDGTPVQIFEQDTSRYRVTPEILSRGRNIIVALKAHPFLHCLVARSTVAQTLPPDAEGLLTVKPRNTKSIATRIGDGNPPEEVLCESLGVSAEVIRSLSRISGRLITTNLLNEIIPVYRHLEPNNFPKNNAEFLSIIFLRQDDFLSNMSGCVNHPNNSRAIEAWLRRRKSFKQKYASFSRIARVFLARFLNDGPPGGPQVITLFSFLGEPSYHELDIMLDTWARIDRDVRAHILFESGPELGKYLDNPDWGRLPDTLDAQEWGLLPDGFVYEDYGVVYEDFGEDLDPDDNPANLISDGIREIFKLTENSFETLWFICLAALVARSPGYYEAIITRAFCPQSNRGFAGLEFPSILNEARRRRFGFPAPPHD